MTLIVMWYAVSISHMRINEYYPQVTMQHFSFQERCERARDTILKMDTTKKIQAVCI